MHEHSMEFRMPEVELPASSPLAGRSLRDANLRQHTNVLVLAVRESDGRFVTNPAPDFRLNAGSVVIAVGTSTDLDRFVAYCRTPR
jgi:voltage-gated potassium channel